MIKLAIENLKSAACSSVARKPLPLNDYLQLVLTEPAKSVRNVFQIFHDMVVSNILGGIDEYPNDPETIHYMPYDCSRLFIEGSQHPFFADRLLANRLVNLVESWKSGAQQNKIYLFEGPPGSGKSTLLNNLLRCFESYCNSDEGARYEVVWRLPRPKAAELMVNDRLVNALPSVIESLPNSDYLEIPCPSHDNPLLLVPPEHRKAFLDDLFAGHPAERKVLDRKEYEWLFKQPACTICSSLYLGLQSALPNLSDVLAHVYVRRQMVSRRLGEGISVFSPGDKVQPAEVKHSELIQAKLDAILPESSQVHYIYSPFARTNDGVYALMDVKSSNTTRFRELHNIVSDGVHKVEHLEEHISSLFIGIVNPEDRKNIDVAQSMQDRTHIIRVPYVLDMNTEIEIYRNIFGKDIDDAFLPRVLSNFARIVVSTRMNRDSASMSEWIGQDNKYRQYCDEGLMLLRMELYSGHIPEWLLEEDVKKLTSKRRRTIISESENEGMEGISGREAIKLFGAFYAAHYREKRHITMDSLIRFFMNESSGIAALVPDGLMDALQRYYNYAILQEVKESLYRYSDKQISGDILDYLYGINFEPGRVEVCPYTKNRVEVSDAFFAPIERKVLGDDVSLEARLNFRAATQKEYTAGALTKEMMVDGLKPTKTSLYLALHAKYAYNLKQKVLDPFLENENFRRAIKDIDSPDFRSYDKKIRDDVRYLVENLCLRYGYTKSGARDVCVYVIDNDLARKFR